MKRIIYLIVISIGMICMFNSVSYTDPSLTRYLSNSATVTTQNLNWGENPLGTENTTHWPVSNITWKFNVDDSQESAEESEDALETAFTQWNNVTQASLIITKGGTQSSPSVSDNSTNVIFFESDETTLRNNNITDTIYASTFISTKDSPNSTEIEDVDIILNAYDCVWTSSRFEVADSSPDTLLIQTFATHEIGHLLGIHHNSISESIMNIQSDTTTVYTLHDEVNILVLSFPR